jgi:hypothetical protein
VEDVLTISAKVAETLIGVLSTSLTFSVKVKVPVVPLGVPEIVALGEPEVSVRPAGKLDPVATLHVYG